MSETIAEIRRRHAEAETFESDGLDNAEWRASLTMLATRAHADRATLLRALDEAQQRVKRLEEIEKCARYVDDAPTVGEKSMRLGELLRLCRARAALNQETKP